jgi:DNA-binding NarL/FixJ family response regulator
MMKASAAVCRRSSNARPASSSSANLPTAKRRCKEIPKLLPDVAIMDINLPGMKGYECVRQLKAAQPTIQFLMLTVYEDSDSLFNSLRAGASGYLLKRTASARLLEAIRDVCEGGSPMTPQLARRVVQFFSKPAGGLRRWPGSRRRNGNFWTNWPTATPTRKSPTG